MAQIQQILLEMEHFLNGQDCSDSEHFRRLAALYADACRIVNEALSECRSLIESGNARQALLLNCRNTPSLTERARILLFPGRSKWVELCCLYHVSIPAEPDMALIEQLESGDFSESVEQNSDLIAQWRVLGHSGTLHEKILLLRKLLKKDTSTDIWRKNLEIAERAWIREKLNEAAAAQKHHDAACLDGIIRQLESSELLHPVPPSETDPYRQDVQAYRASQIREKAGKLLARIENAASMEDTAALGEALCAWNTLSQDPLFDAPSGGDAELLKRAREHFDRKQEQLLLQERSRELHQKLNHLIGMGEDFPRIRAEMCNLTELNVPVDAGLKERYQVLEEEFQLKQKRAARQKVIVWCSGVMLLCVGVALTLYGLNRWYNKRDVCRQMTAFLQQQKPLEIRRYFETLKKEKNPAVRDTEVLALLKKAENMREDQIEQSKSVVRRIEQLRKKLAAGDSDGCRELLDEAWKRFHSQEQQVELESLRLQYGDLLKKKQQERDGSYADALLKLQDAGKKLSRRCDNPQGLELSALDRDLRALENQLKAVSREGVSENFRRHNDRLVGEMLANLNAKVRDTGQYLQLRHKLRYPANAVEFLDALDKIPSLPAFSSPLEKEFESAVRGKDQERLFMNSEFAKKDGKAPDVFSHHPYMQDFQFIRISEETLKNFRSELERLKAEAKTWDLFEVVIPSGGRDYYFYLQGPLSDDNFCLYRAKGQAGGSYRDMRLSVCQPENRTLELLFLIEKQRNSYTLVLQPPPPGLPEKFTSISFAQLRSWAGRKDINKALHYTMFMETLKRLEVISEPEKLREAVLHEIRFYASSRRGNPMARLKIIRSLLKLYGSFSVIDQVFAQGIEGKLASFPAEPTAWNVDRDEIERDIVFFTSPEYAAQQAIRDRTMQLYRKVLNAMQPNPSGVIYLENGRIRIHFFYKKIPELRYFVHLQSVQKGSRFCLLPESLLAKPDSAVSSLAPELTDLENGTLFHSCLLYPQDELLLNHEEVYSIPASIPTNMRSRP